MSTRSIVQLAHILLLGPLLIAIGINSTYIPSWVPMALGIFVILYHAYKMTLAGWNWVNLFHVCVVGPALVAATLIRPAREIVLMLGIAAIGYHGYYLIGSGVGVPGS
jgi:hypothetical protein